MTEQKRGGILIVGDVEEEKYFRMAANYLPKLLEVAKRNPPKPGTVSHISVAHDDWCDLLARRGPCSCNPDVEFLGQEQ